MSKSEIEREAHYEDLLFAELTKHHVFEGRHADKLITLVNNDVAFPEIEASVLDAYSLGKEAVESFMLERLVAAEGSDKPKTPFSARLAKVKAPTMANILTTCCYKSQRHY